MRDEAGRNRTIRITDEAWAELERVALALGCIGQHGEPSVSVLMSEIGGGGSVFAVRAMPPPPRSLAELVRRAIAENPGADDKTIAEAAGCEPLYVYQVRRRAAAARKGG